MPTWSPDEVTLLNELHWHEKTPICPACGATVDVQDTGEIQPVALMTAWCPGCNRRADFPAAAKRGADLSASEARVLVATYLRDSRPLCPHDGTTLIVEDIGGIGTSLFHLRCPRCGASGEVQDGR